ncbi:MAG: dicarboxylate/amino acid:cation symporter [Fidelibacterota bacterium]|nr:MAG: dicarboxylate/amino acid:cation symporter [Candidatus Neomarinimicrobiota bacterium]
MTGDGKSNRLLIAILIGIVLGMLLGGLSPAAGRAVKFIGEIFIRALLMLVVPLIIATMTVGISRLGDIRRIGGIGGKTITYYLATTALSVVVGITLVNLIQPGRADTEQGRIAMRGGELLTDVAYRIYDNTLTLDTDTFQRAYDNRYMVLLQDQDDIRGVVAKSHDPFVSSLIISEWTDGEGNRVTPSDQGVSIRVDLAVAEGIKGKSRSIGTVLRDVVVGLVPRNLFAAMMNNDVLPLIIFSLIFGAVLTTLGERGRPVLIFFEGLNEAIMRIVHLLMLTAPVGIGALIAGRLGDAGGFIGFGPEFVRLGQYAATVLTGLLIHGLITLPLILFFFGKQRVWPYSVNSVAALTTAFSTASSAATLPLTMQCTTEKNKISERTASFVLPLGATINMDGTALYEAVAAIFIAQIYGIDLGSVHMVVIFLTATLAAIGAAGIPEAGLVTMVIVLQAVNLPIEGISLILVIDWFLDRCRTTVNVWGDTVGAAVVHNLEGEGDTD